MGKLERANEQSVRLMLRLSRIASAQGSPCVFIGALVPNAITGIRKVSDVDLVVGSQREAERLFNPAYFTRESKKNGFRFNPSENPVRRKEGVFNGRIGGVNVDVYTRYLSGIPVRTILMNNQPREIGGRTVFMPSREMYVAMKLGIEDFTSADFSGGVSEGPGRGDSPAKKDLRDALSIMEKPSEASYGKELILAINPDTFRKIVKELPRSKRRMITRNMAFIRSNPSIVQEQRRILLARMRFVRRGRNITRGLQAIDFAERQMRKVRLRHENRKG